ncbi:potassium-transporting ATPase subunit F [Thermoleophilia bacterium SCSIO 60948]|nr:potassium-transporting ATPase subunit F [Thermoleophilia bacterium SCSIO 60948]
MPLIDWIALGVGVCLAAYLVLALLRAEEL